MIQASFDEVEQSHIESLVTNSVSEGRTLEYKLMIKASSDGDKKEFLADICSFANTGGGDILIGVREDQGVPQAIPGIDNIDPDKEILRLEGIIRDGIEPRLTGIRSKAISGFQVGPVILIRIPQSWQGPHMVCFQSSSRFFTRGSAGKSMMNVSEIRNAFLMSESIPQRMRAFREERAAMVRTVNSSTPLRGNQHLVMHFLPLASFHQHFSIDMSRVFSRSLSLPYVSGITAWPRPNLDGYIDEYFGGTNDGRAYGYTQLFRNGVIEVVDSYVANGFEQNGRQYIRSDKIETQIHNASVQVLKFLKAFDVPPPVYLFTTLLGVAGMSLYSDLDQHSHQRRKVDRDTLLLPEVELSEPVGRSVKFVCDMFRQSFGAISSPNFDEHGNWLPNR